MGLEPQFVNRYPHEFSGGQCQRVSIARAMILEPKVIVCDEPVSALDVSIQAQICNLLKKLQRDTGVSLIFISHDLSTVASFADDLAVLYNGELVDYGPVKEVLSPPFHPYTELLITSVPELRVGWLDETAEAQQALAAQFKAGVYAESAA